MRLEPTRRQPAATTSRVPETAPQPAPVPGARAATQRPPAPRLSVSFMPGDTLSLTSEPETRLSRPYPFGPDSGLVRKALAYGGVAWELVETYKSPMRMVGRFTTSTEEAIRYRREAIAPGEPAIPSRGVSRTESGWQVPVIPNPADPQAAFDPYAFMPTFVFGPREDSFPVVPDRDGDGNLLTDAAGYRHGVIGGTQPLSGVFSVAQKGEYTVLVYGLYYVDNKAGDFHLTDSSTVAIYLKPAADGKLAPEYVYTSWHHGAGMARWEDLKKDAQGRPVIEVGRGSHALRPLAPREDVSEQSLVVRGDGRAFLGKKPLPNRLTWLTAQPNVRNARPIDPTTARGNVLMETYFDGYPERTNPYHPIFFGFPRG